MSKIKVGLINIEPKVANTAYMQIAGFHRSVGHTVEFAEPLEFDKYELLYCSSLFDFTDKSIIPIRAICGGTGFNRHQPLPGPISDHHLDYSIYPDCSTSYIWFSRGCFRNCPFCVVRQKEGYIRPVEPKNLNPKGKFITVMDNNFFGGDWPEAIEILKQWDQPVQFEGGIDCRLWDGAYQHALEQLKIHGMLYVAWDDPKEDLLPNIRKINKWFEKVRGYPKNPPIGCYVLIGYWSTPEEDLDRVEKLRDMHVEPWVMKYHPNDPYESKFARWVNFKPAFRKCTWEQYQKEYKDDSDEPTLFGMNKYEK